jgi:hypothetical protein
VESFIKESGLNRFFRLMLNAIRISGSCFLLCYAIFLVAIDWSIGRVIFGLLSAALALGILTRVQILKIEAVRENTITLSSGTRLLELNKGNIFFVAKVVRYSINDRFALMIAKKSSRLWNFKLLFFMNEPEYDILGTFSHMGIRIRNVPS